MSQHIGSRTITATGGSIKRVGNYRVHTFPSEIVTDGLVLHIDAGHPDSHDYKNLSQFMKNTDLCGELKKLKNSVRKEFKLPKKCPISAGRNFQLDQVLDESFWKSVGSYKKYVVGAFGMLELRLWDSKPCTVCWSGPKLLAGISIPFKIKESNKHIDL